MNAFGHPGVAPTWTSSAKDMVGCALGPARLWFTTGYGILNEVYYPRVDIPQIRDLGFIVADGKGFWVEVKRMNAYQMRLPFPGIPAVEIIHMHDRFELRLRIAPDPDRDVLLVEVALSSDSDLRPYALLAPHLGGTGHDNMAQTGVHGGCKMLWANQGPFALALSAANARQVDAWGAISAGYVGASDGWQDFNRNGAMTWGFAAAGPGNIALMGELPAQATLALGFGTSQESAATLAVSSLCQPFCAVWDRHVAQWRDWISALVLPPNLPSSIRDQVVTSAMVLRVHQDKTYPGAMVASLSIPWGNSRDDIGGYHLVWPRDLVESAGGLLALNAVDEARDILRYLIATQHAQGNWSQNQWLGGKPFWHGEQLDETAFPVLLATALVERAALDGVEIQEMVRLALTYIARNGPATSQDRWEEDAGINTFTLAVCVSALVCGAEFLDEPARSFALDLADFWNTRIEEWTSAGRTDLAHAMDISGYYVRIAPPADALGQGALTRVLPIKNREFDLDLPANAQIGTDFLQLVRFGLRDPRDPLIVDTIKIVDAQLKVELSDGVAWRRYTGDGYGERSDGGPFEGVGVGRAWPLLAGERGHYELLAGKDPLPFLRSMAAMTGRGSLIPEQVWDAQPIPDRGLIPGKPTGSAMPLVWAHAEFIKLATSIALGAPCDRPKAVWQRYRGRRPEVLQVIWTIQFPLATLNPGQCLVVSLPEPAIVHYGRDGWRDVTDVSTLDGGLGLHLARIPTAQLRAGQRVDLTFFWASTQSWEGRDFRVEIRAMESE